MLIFVLSYFEFDEVIIMLVKKLMVLVIFDGWGYCEDNVNNVINNVNILVMDSLIVNNLNIFILVLGMDVGLLDG